LSFGYKIKQLLKTITTFLYKVGRKIHTSKCKKAILSVIALLLIAYIFCLPRQLFNVPYSTVVTDRNGELLGARIADDEQWRFPACDTVN
jgi:membrane carboxypeptidase/penicillin-binding protein PbpC